jgi:hypothetical protein
MFYLVVDAEPALKIFVLNKSKATETSNMCSTQLSQAFRLTDYFFNALTFCIGGLGVSSSSGSSSVEDKYTVIIQNVGNCQFTWFNLLTFIDTTMTTSDVAECIVLEEQTCF